MKSNTNLISGSIDQASPINNKMPQGPSIFEDTKDRKKLLTGEVEGLNINSKPSLEGMGLNGYEKSENGSQRDMRVVKGAFRGSNNLDSSDVIFKPDDIVKDSSF